MPPDRPRSDRKEPRLDYVAAALSAAGLGLMVSKASCRPAPGAGSLHKKRTRRRDFGFALTPSMVRGGRPGAVGLVKC